MKLLDTLAPAHREQMMEIGRPIRLAAGDVLIRRGMRGGACFYCSPVLIPQIIFGGLLVRVKDLGEASAALPWLTVVRYAFEGALRTGQRFSVAPPDGLSEFQERPLRGVLYSLGFREGGEDMGLSFLRLMGILTAIFLGLLAATIWRTRKSSQRKG